MVTLMGVGGGVRGRGGGTAEKAERAARAGAIRKCDRAPGRESGRRQFLEARKAGFPDIILKRLRQIFVADVFVSLANSRKTL